MCRGHARFPGRGAFGDLQFRRQGPVGELGDRVGVTCGRRHPGAAPERLGSLAAKAA
jgi:hypothetical protein